MISVYINNIVRFIVVILLQILIFDNIRLGGYITPYLYILFILLLPFKVRGSILLVSAFLLGLFIDIFYNTPGMHSAACVFIAFIRPFTLKIFSPRDGYETGTGPRIYYYGIAWFTKYAVTLVFIHHLTLFSIETFRLDQIHIILLRTLLSSLVSILVVILSQYFIFRK